VVRDLTVLHTHHINRFEMDLAMGRSNAKKRALVRAVIGLVRRHPVAVCKLQVDLSSVRNDLYIAEFFESIFAEFNANP
jgi:hypothetical protein